MAWTVPVAADLTQRRFAKAVGGDADEPRGSDLVVVTEVARTAASPNANVKRLWKRMMGLEPTTFCMASRRSSQLSYIRVVGRHDSNRTAGYSWSGGISAAIGGLRRSRSSRRDSST